MKKALYLVLACLALGLVASGCGGDDEDSGSSADQPADTAADSPPAGAAPAKGAVEVGMQNIEFDPTDVTVKKGGTITWTNNESVPHDVTKEDGPGPDFSSGDPGGMGEGDTFEHTFDAVGEINYVCTIHSNMTGTITVE